MANSLKTGVSGILLTGYSDGKDFRKPAVDEPEILPDLFHHHRVETKSASISYNLFRRLHASLFEGLPTP
jgi:hypothetical protein